MLSNMLNVLAHRPSHVCCWCLRYTIISNLGVVNNWLTDFYATSRTGLHQVVKVVIYMGTNFEFY